MEIELKARLDLIEERQKHVLGNQAAILELIEKERVRSAMWRSQLRYDPKPFIYAFLAVLGFGVVLSMI